MRGTGGSVADDCASCHTRGTASPARSAATATSRRHRRTRSTRRTDRTASAATPSIAAPRSSPTIPSTTCVACHTNLEQHMTLPRAQLASLRFANGRYSFEDIARISAFRRVEASRALVSEGREHPPLQSQAPSRAEGRVQREREARRPAVRDLPRPHRRRPIRSRSTFEQHCHDCHRLELRHALPQRRGSARRRQRHRLRLHRRGSTPATATSSASLPRKCGASSPRASA